MTQTEFDSAVDYLIGKLIRLARECAYFRKQNDPASLRREIGCIMLQNCISALQYYDMTSGLLTDDEIDDTIELATQITLSWPLDNIYTRGAISGSITMDGTGITMDHT